mmetsp:Transcript_11785/g.37360  ORF Transcript_11785/g.37360 Transcript_11785/m.37360 type:complete len:208 (-) Transcript_11785:91-714(-)
MTRSRGRRASSSHIRRPASECAALSRRTSSSPMPRTRSPTICSPRTTGRACRPTRTRTTFGIRITASTLSARSGCCSAGGGSSVGTWRWIRTVSGLSSRRVCSCTTFASRRAIIPSTPCTTASETLFTVSTFNPMALRMKRTSSSVPRSVRTKTSRCACGCATVSHSEASSGRRAVGLAPPIAGAQRRGFTHTVLDVRSHLPYQSVS